MDSKVNAGAQPAAESFPSAGHASGHQRIGDIAREFGVTLRTLRFYEDKGLLTPKREGTTRLYSHRDRARLKLILLGRRVGFSLRDVKQMIDLYDPAGSNARQLRVALDKSEKQLARLHKQRAALDEAIGELSGLILRMRGDLADGRTPRLVG
ncbi:MAG: MerR family DNA-binding transcriptional regulator [Rhizobiales bacterium]|nr:MerR family DNA-binding transcriptional regulator [Hyphomicrobiales bacterium]